MEAHIENGLNIMQVQIEAPPQGITPSEDEFIEYILNFVRDFLVDYVRSEPEKRPRLMNQLKDMWNGRVSIEIGEFSPHTDFKLNIETSFRHIRLDGELILTGAQYETQ